MNVRANVRACEAACQGALEAAFQTIMAARNATHTSILTQAFRFLNAVIAREPTYVEDAFTERVCDRIVYIGLTTRDRQLEWRAGAVLYRMLKARRRQTERIPEWLEQRASGSIILLVERFLKSSDPRLHLVALLLVCQLCTAFVGRARGIGFNLLDKTKDLIIQMKAESPSMSLRQLAADIIARYLRLLVPEGCRVQHTIPEILNVQAPEERLAEKPVDIHLEWASDTIAR
nr:hypothetical protein BaRGS_002579 [Batillaria attramentaria]